MTSNSSEYYPQQNEPLHIGIIPDGGRRWAKINHTTLIEAYDKSRDLLQKIATWCFSKNTDTLSIYVASFENFKRSNSEKEAFCKVVNGSLETDFLELAHQLKVKINVVGERSMFNDKLIRSVDNIQTKTADYQNGEINLCIAYDPIKEIQRAVKKAKQSGSFLEYLDIKKPTNLIIRTGNANLLSNFLPLQSGFARVYFINKLFNDLTLEETKSIYESYLQLNLKYGE